MVEIEAVLFDLYGTLCYAEGRMTENEISDFLFEKGYDVSPQQLKAAWAFVSFIDYPKYGYKSWGSFFSRIFQRLKISVDQNTVMTIAKQLEASPYKLYSDAKEAVVNAKKSGFKTGIVTTIAHFQFEEAIKPIRKCLDYVMTGYEAGVDKSDPRMYRKILEILNVPPSRAVMIGDDVQLDILLPKKLGMKAILLDRQGNTVKEKGAVDAFVYNLNEAVETIIRWCVKN